MSERGFGGIKGIRGKRQRRTATPLDPPRGREEGSAFVVREGDGVKERCVFVSVYERLCVFVSVCERCMSVRERLEVEKGGDPRREANRGQGE